MSEPFLGEIRMAGFNFAPRGWAFCNGQLLMIAQNTALFSILGTTYGGNGTTTFGLPNLQGRSPMGWGQGPGLSNRVLGETGGEETHTLTLNEMPAHPHTLNATGATGTTGTPGNTVTLAATSGANVYRPDTNTVAMGAGLTPSGTNLPHDNRQPCLAVSFIIALQGIFPARN
jgi:microcystin-dependent protein